MEKMKSEKTYIMMARYLAGEMGSKEEIAFREQLKRDHELEKELEHMEKGWKQLSEDPRPGSIDSGKAWDKLYGRLKADGLLDENIPGQGKRVVMPFLRIAASILLVLALGIPALYLGVIRNHTRDTAQKQVTEQGVTTVDLPDGSRVFLNERSEITYQRDFDEGRNVELRGEAFFEVMSDPVNPFTVRSGKVVISVLGTSFNVKEVSDEHAVEVFVESGKVRMALESTGEFITLEPGSTGCAGSSLVTRSGMPEPNYISWKTKDFKFVDEELVNVLRELEESYHVTIHTDDEELDGLRITTTYSEQSIDAILETIGTAFDMTIRKKRGDYFLIR